MVIVDWKIIHLFYLLVLIFVSMIHTPQFVLNHYVLRIYPFLSTFSLHFICIIIERRDHDIISEEITRKNKNVDIIKKYAISYSY